MPCPPGKIINPATGRCVKVDGAIGKKLMKAKTPVKKAKECPPGKVRNPASKRCVKATSPVGKKLALDKVKVPKFVLKWSDEELKERFLHVKRRVKLDKIKADREYYNREYTRALKAY